MKTMLELYNEIMESQELKDQFIEAAKAGKQGAFLKEHGCEATLEEVQAFLEAKTKEDAPLSIDELENTAGGSSVACETIASVFTAGLGCAFAAIKSAARGYVGKRQEGDGNLCNRY